MQPLRRFNWPSLLLGLGWLMAGPAAIQPAAAQDGGAVAHGQLTDRDTGAPLPYVSIGIRGTPVGTVADEHGRFSLLIPAERAADSLWFSLLGYQPAGRVARTLMAGAPAVVALRPLAYALPEAVVLPRTLRQRVRGNPSTNSRSSTAKFEDNLLGNQFGQSIAIRRPAWLEQVSFHVGECSYDSLLFRINIFALDSATRLPGANLLPQPVYVRVRKGEINDRIAVDLRHFNLRLTDDVVVALETIRDLGKGELQLSARILGGPVYFREGAQGKWEALHGYGLGIDATILEEN